jgi:putative ABC transport system permease protein
VAVLLKPFNDVAGKSFAFSSIFTTNTFFFVLGLCLLTGILAGLYPAFYLTKFKPVEVLKGMKLSRSTIGNL